MHELYDFSQQTLDAQTLRKMRYSEFILTPYWQAVAFHAKQEKPWCALCTEPLAGPLEAHHRTYEHRGDEWRHLEDLIVLCGPCHELTRGRRRARG